MVKFGAMGVSPARAAAERGEMDEALRILGTATLGAEAFRGLSKARLEQARANLAKAALMTTDYVPLAADEVRAVDTPTSLINGAQSRALRQVLSEASGGNAAVYVYGVASLAQVEGDGFAWFLGDALSLVRQAVDDDGEVVLARDYAPFGVLLSESGTPTQRCSSCGRGCTIR